MRKTLLSSLLAGDRSIAFDNLAKRYKGSINRAMRIPNMQYLERS
jgi:hypothetical protein